MLLSKHFQTGFVLAELCLVAHSEFARERLRSIPFAGLRGGVSTAGLGEAKHLDSRSCDCFLGRTRPAGVAVGLAGMWVGEGQRSSTCFASIDYDLDAAVFLTADRIIASIGIFVRRDGMSFPVPLDWRRSGY
jgi:hypothetical protein